MPERSAMPSISTVARFGRAAWFFGNAYEAAVGVPQLIAGTRRQGGILATGSPVRYFAPVAPAAVGGTALVLLQSWKAGGDRRGILAATATLGAAVALSAYLIGSVNVPLLRGKVSEERESRLISRWHWANAVRLGLLAMTGIVVHRVEASRQSPSRNAAHPVDTLTE